MSDLPPHIEVEISRLGVVKPIKVCKPEPTPPPSPSWDGKGECPY